MDWSVILCIRWDQYQELLVEQYHQKATEWNGYGEGIHMNMAAEQVEFCARREYTSWSRKDAVDTGEQESSKRKVKRKRAETADSEEKVSGTE